MSPATERSDSAIREVARVMSIYNSFVEFMALCEDTAVLADTTGTRRKGRSEQEEDPSPHAGWPEKTAFMLSKSFGTAAEKICWKSDSRCRELKHVV